MERDVLLNGERKTLDEYVDGLVRAGGGIEKGVDLRVCGSLRC